MTNESKMPEPHGYLFERCEFMYPEMLDQEVKDDPSTFAVYTVSQMRTFAQEAARQAMETAAMAVREGLMMEPLTAEQIIRALIPQSEERHG